MIKNLNMMSPVDFGSMGVAGRREFIKRYMKAHFLGKSFNCPVLGRDVKVSADSIKETANHASKSTLSTIAAINLPAVIREAEWAYASQPKAGVQTKRFHATKVHVLFTQMSDQDVAKLTLVEKGDKYFVEYCVTAQKSIAAKLCSLAWVKVADEAALIAKQGKR